MLVLYDGNQVTRNFVSFSIVSYINSMKNIAYIPNLLIGCLLLGSAMSLLEDQSAIATETDKTSKTIIEPTPNLTQLKSHPEVLEQVKICIESKSEYLSLSYLELTEIPSGIPILAHVKFVELEENKLNRLGPEITKMSGLVALIVDNNELESLEGISKLTALKELYFKNYKLASLPESFGKLSSLRYLNLKSNRLNSLPEKFGKLASLKYLNLRSNRLSSLPESLSNCKELEYLILGGNQLSQLPDDLGNLTNLTVLVLSKNQLEDYPPNFQELSSLQYLYLDQNKFKSLPREIEGFTELLELSFIENPITDEQLLKLKTLSKLQYLDIRHTKVTKEAVAELQQALPDCFIRDSVTPPFYPQMDIVLSRIREAYENDENRLDLKRGGLTSLPREIGEASKVEYLMLGQNKLKTLPPEIKHLKKLIQISLYMNQIESLPDEILELPELCIINLSDNRLKEVPPQLYQLKKMFSLELSFNSISHLSDDALSWSKINYLKLGNNKFQKFPEVITKLNTLTYLTLYDNQIKEIPPEISNLKQLRVLDFSDNKISSLPETFGSLKSLSILDLDNNPITDADLKYIKQLKNLEDLDIRKTKITYAGYLSLREALPNCAIAASFNESR
ncbi:MAG: hypothetical protein COA78_25535 [Blastopirellula sp.]|nr:MAG: hypothetical protein COA78_25535 [Blastopirellula sp.]